ncbi:hypothetical protein [Oerskovia rustica]|uniref:Secreted protein n=1 Tax=Oerskovia rustica TaxID=2762237 RepID=A0ABR8RX35_9CELL|nr:hypothetical protein [Oerskovia rustica]MBD7952346.1 hypothetical protein [Oerskovia rustica]
MVAVVVSGLVLVAFVLSVMLVAGRFLSVAVPAATRANDEMSGLDAPATDRARAFAGELGRLPGVTSVPAPGHVYHGFLRNPGHVLLEAVLDHDATPEEVGALVLAVCERAQAEVDLDVLYSAVLDAGGVTVRITCHDPGFAPAITDLVEMTRSSVRSGEVARIGVSGGQVEWWAGPSRLGTHPLWEAEWAAAAAELGFVLREPVE